MVALREDGKERGGLRVKCRDEGAIYFEGAVEEAGPERGGRIRGSGCGRGIGSRLVGVAVVVDYR